MKKLVSLSLAIILCLSFLILSSSCSSVHPIEEFKNKMVKADSFQMTATMSNVPLFGTLTITTKVDGNIQYTPAIMFSSEEYIETVGDIEYKYTKNDDGKWTKTEKAKEDDSSSVASPESIDAFFNPENYEVIKGEENSFKQKKDVVFENFEDVVLTIEENSCTFEMMSVEGYGVKLVFSKIGEVELTLPTVE